MTVYVDARLNRVVNILTENQISGHLVCIVQSHVYIDQETGSLLIYRPFDLDNTHILVVMMYLIF